MEREQAVESESAHPDDARLRDAAQRIANALLAPRELLKSGIIPETQFTMADMIRMGATILYALNDGYRDQMLKVGNREFMDKVFESIHSPEALEEFLYGRFKQKSATEAELEQAIAETEDLMSGPGSVRRVMKQAMAEGFPEPVRGRPSNFNPVADPVRFLSASAELENMCKQFLGLQRSFPRKSTEDLLEFIGQENPKPAAMKTQAAFISQVVSNPDFAAVKGEATMARRLADAISGKVLFHWSWTYSVQKGQEFRRAKARAGKE